MPNFVHDFLDVAFQFFPGSRQLTVFFEHLSLDKHDGDPVSPTAPKHPSRRTFDAYDDSLYFAFWLPENCRDFFFCHPVADLVEVRLIELAGRHEEPRADN